LVSSKYIRTLHLKFEKLYKNILNKKLQHIAQIRFGLYTKPKPKGAIQYLQAKQFDNAGNMISSSDMFLDEDNKILPHLLMDGDILLAGKGFRIFSWRYSESLGPAVASSIFFVIRPDRHKVDPDYLTTLLNMNKSQAYFEQLGAGTNINSIRKNELGEFPVPMLPMEEQMKIRDLNRLHNEQVKLLDKYTQLAEDRYNAILNKLIKDN
jgi:restriction endonuclease S subunit